MIEEIKKSLLELIPFPGSKDGGEPRRRPVTHEFYEKVLVFELDGKGDLVCEREYEGSINTIYNDHLREILGFFVYRRILADTIKAFYSEKYTFEELKEHARRVLNIFINFGVFGDDRRVAIAVVNNRKFIFINDELIDLSTMRTVKLPFLVDDDILDPKSLLKYLKPLPYSKVRVVYFGTYKNERRLFKGTRAVVIKFGYLTAVVDEDGKVLRLGGDKGEAELEYGLVTFDELYSTLRSKTVRQMLLYVYDKLSPTAKRSIDAMSRKKNELFENIVQYLASVSLTVRGVYVFRYYIKSGEDRKGTVFFVQMSGVRRLNPTQTTTKPSFAKPGS